jgi:hypothetical protein
MIHINHPETMAGTSHRQPNDVEAAAAEARQRKLEQQRAEQAAASIEMDIEVVGEWARRLADLAARLPNLRTEAGRDLVGRLRVRSGVMLNDIELAGFGRPKK